MSLPALAYGGSIPPAGFEVTMSDTPTFGTFGLGRLKYRTEKEAKAAGDELGLDDTHSHDMDYDDDGEAETLFMPGADHGQLNDALTDRGLDPKPGKQAMGSQSKMDPMQTGSDGMQAMMDETKREEMNLGMGTDDMVGERPEESGPFHMFGDSDKDGDMEIY